MAPPDPVGPADTEVRPSTARARRGLAIFLSLVIVFNALILTLMTISGNLAWIFALMGSVALSSIVARLVQREGFADVSFRLGGRRVVYWYVVGLLFGPVVGFVAFGFAWLTGLAGEEIGWRGYMLTRLIDAGVPRPVLVGSILWACGTCH